MYYSYDKLISRGAYLNFVIGERGVGKTFGAKLFCVKDFIKRGNQFVYIRRYKTELDKACSDFFNDLQKNHQFDDLELTCKKDKGNYIFKMDGEVIGYGIALTTSVIQKSSAFPDVKNVIFDEFLINQGTAYRYLTDEVHQFLELIESIGRLRDLRILMLGNATSITNPYFAYFDLTLPYGSEFKSFKDGLICVNYIKNLAYRATKKRSKLGRLTEGTDYANYAIDNEFYYDNKDFIGKKSPEAKFWGCLVLDNLTIGIWRDFKLGYTYLSSQYDPNTPLKFACSINDHKTNTIFMQYRKNPHIKMVIEAFQIGMLQFENQNIKNHVIKLINKCIAR